MPGPPRPTYTGPMTSATYQAGSGSALGLWVGALFVVMAALFGMRGIGAAVALGRGAPLPRAAAA